MKVLLSALIGFLVGALAGTLTLIILAFPWLERLVEWAKEWQNMDNPDNPPTTTEEAQP